MASRLADRNVAYFPANLSTFVGRRDDIVSAKDALIDRRLVVLIGPAGVGKSCLAVHVSSQLAETTLFERVRWVSLSALPPDAGMPMIERAVAESFGVVDFSLTSPRRDLLYYLAGQVSLVVLDSCEHL